MQAHSLIMHTRSNSTVPLVLTLSLFIATLWLTRQGGQGDLVVKDKDAPLITGEKPVSLDGLTAQALLNMGHAWMAEGVYQKKPVAFRHAARVFLALRSTIDQKTEPDNWALASHLLGTAQMNEGDSFNDAAKLVSAEEHFRAALALRSPARNAAEWNVSRHHLRRAIGLSVSQSQSEATFLAALAKMAAMAAEPVSTPEDRSDTLASKALAYQFAGYSIVKDKTQKLAQYKTALALYAEARNGMPGGGFAFDGDTHTSNEIAVKRYIECRERNADQPDLIALLKQIEETMFKKS
jgi:tetratricopeptide (TPR) repeat protein